jgi:hypothetical protein
LPGLIWFGVLKNQYTATKKHFPMMEEFLKLHQEEEHYFMFVQEFVRIVVGKKRWTHQCFRLNLSEYCSASGEAFVLLTLENNYMRWSDMAETGDYGDKNHTAPPPLYTNAGKSNRKLGTARPFQGWSVEGYERFDVLHKLVLADRAKQSRCRFEEMLKNILMEENTKKRQRPEEEEDDGGEVVYPAHDFADVDRGGISSEDKSDDDKIGHCSTGANEEEHEHGSDDSGNEDDDEECSNGEEEQLSAHSDNEEEEEEEDDF